MGGKGAKQLAGGCGNMAGEQFHAGFLAEHGIRTEGLAQALDGGSREDSRDGLALGVAASIVLQQATLEGCRQVGIGIAQKAGEVIGGGAAAHALVINHDRLRTAKEDIAGLPVAMDQSRR